MDLLDGVPPMPKKGKPEPAPAAPQPASSADAAIAANLRRMEDAKVPIAPAAKPVAAAPVSVGRWWEGRTFYHCPCGARDEKTSADAAPHPETLPCWQDKCDGIMRQWTPPGVERERLRG